MTHHLPAWSLSYLAVALLVGAILSLCDLGGWINAALGKVAGAL